MKLKIGFSPCPNDTFIMYALLHGKVESYDLQFEPVIEDVQQLNVRAINNDLPVTKMSFFAYANSYKHYKILNAGSALGKNCGPLLISKNELTVDELTDKKIAIPGVNTTANLLLSIFYPQLKNKTAMLFSDIEKVLLNENFDAGVIIHENRFTYQQKGLKKIADLGELWETQTGHHIPLGCFAVNNDLPVELQTQIDKALKASIEYAFTHREEVMPFVRKYSQEMEEAVMLQHINLYVNNYSINLGEEGREAIRFLFEKGKAAGLLDVDLRNIFLDY